MDEKLSVTQQLIKQAGISFKCQVKLNKIKPGPGRLGLKLTNL